ncbi:DUF4124 domain-containing protein [Zestomonas carbonaria]|uniref:DUF4124 domain-containing protein n=1 Tax=Zestomonas carbonaria TaxID=2762745 RepID=A0A7U7IBP2_9GAMM|nr:DUF4124 domain-containing protein [Pseudomonas carbonaria]CAD5110501.1 hypothetical protein PSEWESI4_04824 [Pseudomonas carbonaria]
MRIALLCLALLGLPAAAQVYTYIDAEGNRVFTDRPTAGNAQRLQLAPTNAMPAPRPGTPQAPQVAAPPAPPSYQLLRILVPEPDAAVQNGTSGDLIVTATSEPGLLPGHQYRLLLDGEPAGEPSRSPVFQLTNIDRGTHQIAVEILDTNGSILERTPSQPVHILRTSLAQKRKIKPCQKEDYGKRPECPLKDKPEDEVSILPFF